MTFNDWAAAWKALGYIVAATAAVGEEPGHDEIQEAVNALAEILLKFKPEAGKENDRH